MCGSLGSARIVEMASRTPTPINPGMLPGPSKITLDQESFKALASDVRVGILKTLDERRQTVTDLSNIMALSKPTLLEHLEKLQSAGLVKRVDEGRKWVYYELSDKGRKILHPERVSIVVALSSAVALAAIGIVVLLSAAPGALSAPRTGTDPAQALEAPTFFQAIASSNVMLGIVLVALAGVAVGVALTIRWIGRRRRERFFAQLVGA